MAATPPVRAMYRMRDAGWVVTARPTKVPVAAYGRTLETARRNITAALKETMGSSGSPVIDDDIGVSSKAAAAIDRARAAKDVALKAAAESNLATVAAARTLEAEGLSLRDIAYVLGISHSRVHQVIGRAGRTKGTKSP